MSERILSNTAEIFSTFLQMTQASLDVAGYTSKIPFEPLIFLPKSLINS